MKDRFEFWHDEDQQKSHDRDRHRHDDDRINHGGDDFVFDFGRLFLKLGQPREHELEHAADFASLDHIDVKIVKDERKLLKTFGECVAALDRIGKFLDRAFQNLVAFLFGENVEPAQQWQAGIDQGRELTREDH